jgi:hypothetical protein
VSGENVHVFDDALTRVESSRFRDGRVAEAEPGHRVRETPKTRPYSTSTGR